MRGRVRERKCLKEWLEGWEGWGSGMLEEGVRVRVGGAGGEVVIGGSAISVCRSL